MKITQVSIVVAVLLGVILIVPCYGQSSADSFFGSLDIFDVFFGGFKDLTTGLGTSAENAASSSE
jgi:hypothetical protein